MQRDRRRRTCVRSIGTAGVVALLTLGAALPGRAAAADAAGQFSIREVLPAVIGRQPVAASEVSPGPSPVPSPRASDAAARLRERFGPRFAGAWDVPVGGTSVQPTVALTGTIRSSDRDAAAAIVGGVVDVQPASTSLDELERMKASAIARLADAGVSASLVGVNIPRNVLEVDVDPASVPPSAESVITDLAAESRIVARTSAMRVTSYPNPEWSGQRVFLPLSGGRVGGCTTGFAVRNAVGVFQTLAAHCVTGDGQQVLAAGGDSINSTVGGAVSSVVGYQAPGNARGDFAAFAFPNAVGFVYGANRSVKGAGDPVWLEQGVCFRGATSVAEKCAGVSNVDYTVTTTGPDGRTWQFAAFCIDHGAATPGLPGDSGAAMYRAQGSNEALARGIVSGTVGSKTCGTPIQSVLTTYQAQIVVK